MELGKDMNRSVRWKCMECGEYNATPPLWELVSLASTWLPAENPAPGVDDSFRAAKNELDALAQWLETWSLEDVKTLDKLDIWIDNDS